MGAIERRGLTFLRVGGMASLEEAIRVLGDVSEPMGRRCLAAKAVYLLGKLEELSLAVRWVRDPHLGKAIDWAHKWRFERVRAGVSPEQALAQLMNIAETAACRHAAAFRLAKLQGQHATPIFLQLLLNDGSSEALCDTCAEAIAHLGARRTTRVLMRIVRYRHTAPRRLSALRALVSLRDKRAIDLCLRVAADSERETEEARAPAIEALGVGVGRRRVDRALIGYLNHPLESLRVAAGNAVQSVAPRLVGQALRSAMIGVV